MTQIAWPGLLALAIVVTLPGYFVLKALHPEPLHALDFSEVAFSSVLGSLVLVSWLALVLAEFGLFNVPLVLLSVAALSGAAVLFARRRGATWRLPRPALSSASALTFALFAAAVWLFARPAEAFIVIDDSGVYTLAGIHLARTGDLFAYEPALARLPPDLAAQVLFSGPHWAQWTRFWGSFFIWDWYRDVVVFGFLHLPRLWAGLFALLLGPQASVWFNPLFALVGTAGVYLLGRRLFSRIAGWLAALFLAVSFPQVWFARYPLSEMPEQALLFGGLFLLALAMKQRHHAWWLAAGATLGTLALVRPEAVVIVAVVGMAVAWWQMRHGREAPIPEFPARADLATPAHPSAADPAAENTGPTSQLSSAEFRWFFAALLVTFGLGSLHSLLFGWRYLVWVFHLLTPGLARLIVLASLVVAILVVLLAARRSQVRALASATLRRPWLLAGGALLLTAGLLAAVPFSRWSVYWLGQYWTWPGLIFAAGGFVLMWRLRSVPGAWPFLAVAAAFGALLILQPNVNPIQPWGLRRFVPLVFPTLALGAGVAVAGLPSRPGLLEHAPKVLVASGLLISLAAPNASFVTHSEFQAAYRQLGDLAARFEPDAVVFFDDYDPSWHVAQPLAYAFGRQVFGLQRDKVDDDFLPQFLDRLDAHDRPLYLVLSGGSLDWHPPGVRFEPLGPFTLQVPVTERTTGTSPRAVVPLTYRFDLYRIHPEPGAEADPAPAAPTTLDMGSGEYDSLRGGFYGPESTPDGTTYRWTNGQARVVLPPATPGSSLELSIAGGRPPGVDPGRVSVWIDGAYAGERLLDPGYAFQTWRVPLPAGLDDVSDGLDIELRSETFVPLAAGYNDDPRSLGIMVDRIGLAP